VRRQEPGEDVSGCQSEDELVDPFLSTRGNFQMSKTTKITERKFDRKHIAWLQGRVDMLADEADIIEAVDLPLVREAYDDGEFGTKAECNVVLANYLDLAASLRERAEHIREMVTYEFERAGKKVPASLAA
jgi:hypothetical protein